MRCSRTGHSVRRCPTHARQASPTARSDDHKIRMQKRFFRRHDLAGRIARSRGVASAARPAAAQRSGRLVGGSWRARCGPAFGPPNMHHGRDAAGPRPHDIGNAYDVDRQIGEDRPLGKDPQQRPPMAGAITLEDDPAGRIGGTTRTGRVSLITTSPDTEPRNNEEIGPWPRDPMRTRSAQKSTASSTSTVAGRPRRTTPATSRPDRRTRWTRSVSRSSW